MPRAEGQCITTEHIDAPSVQRRDTFGLPTGEPLQIGHVGDKPWRDPEFGGTQAQQRFQKIERGLRWFAPEPRTCGREFGR